MQGLTEHFSSSFSIHCAVPIYHELVNALEVGGIKLEISSLEDFKYDGHINVGVRMRFFSSLNTRGCFILAGFVSLHPMLNVQQKICLLKRLHNIFSTLTHYYHQNP